ncbi:MAG: HDIG domain-containing protein, partial [candidate division Zixibacteria bacterium]|nr:HDIG domain-containing protein [candidate division Zixibacteria bacterium]
IVSNMGEQAAERIGANSLLVRVMAYYHDIGKMQRPYFFIENQPEGINVHERLDPKISAQIILGHVKDGLDLANKYRLPQAIKDGIVQHQGTGMVKYFYYQAMQAAKGTNLIVDEAEFRYPGPKPQSKEVAILMLADISESTVRALKPASVEEIDEIVQKLISDKLNSGELNECDLTIADLHNIRSAFVDILQGVHHPRIKYPDQIKVEAKTKIEQVEQKPSTSENTTGDSITAPASLQVLTESQSQPANLIRRE